MKVVATLIITKKYFSEEETKQTVKDIETYIYHVEKLFGENSTKTVVTYLDETRRINEVAKMISGEEKPSINAINNAKELLNDC